jgi:hypothetical protein
MSLFAVNSAGCRPSRIAFVISGSRNARQRKRVTYALLKPSARVMSKRAGIIIAVVAAAILAALIMYGLGIATKLALRDGVTTGTDLEFGAVHVGA